MQISVIFLSEAQTVLLNPGNTVISDELQMISVKILSW